jgi:hypothetical protein
MLKVSDFYFLASAMACSTVYFGHAVRCACDVENLTVQIAKCWARAYIVLRLEIVKTMICLRSERSVASEWDRSARSRKQQQGSERTSAGINAVRQWVRQCIYCMDAGEGKGEYLNPGTYTGSFKTNV